MENFNRLFYILTFSLLMTQNFGFGQKFEVIKTYGDTLSIINAKFSDSMNLEMVFFGDLSTKKPLILFIPGSGPMPILTIKDSKIKFLGPSFFEKEYNYLVISKPFIPSEVKFEDLNRNYFYLDTNSNLPPSGYTKHNNLIFYSNYYGKIIDNLHKKLKFTNLFLVGHSQGARIALELANHKEVDKLVFMSADPLGRIATRVDYNYGLFEKGDSTKTNAYLEIFNLSDSSEGRLMEGENIDSWVSFSKPTIGSLETINIPTLIVYGEYDRNCPNCYAYKTLPVFNKEIQVISYGGFNHNFFDSEGKNNWKIVMVQVQNWLLCN